MNKPPPGPEFEPADVDRLIARFNRAADPDKRQELDSALEGEKERFKEQERARESRDRGTGADRTI